MKLCDLDEIKIQIKRQDYDYDIVIHNDGNLENLRNKAIQFLLNEENIKFNT